MKKNKNRKCRLPDKKEAPKSADPVMSIFSQMIKKKITDEEAMKKLEEIGFLR